MRSAEEGTGMPPEQDQTLGALFANATHDLSTLVHSEIELAKAELRQDVKSGAKGGAMFGAAAFLGVLALVLLSIAAAYGLVAAGLHPALAFLVVAVVYLLVAGLLALVGRKAVARLNGAERTIRTSKETAAYLKQRRAHADTPTRG
jgi:hypothetical protein